ncbi:hypothetical protein [Streptomyces goshikiensis]|uniref:hypothetical protein n=1 Tax=Streptomyces goshikiensis TaxID=1942 RepID=UPI00367CE93F
MTHRSRTTPRAEALPRITGSDLLDQLTHAAQAEIGPGRLANHQYVQAAHAAHARFQDLTGYEPCPWALRQTYPASAR